MIWLAFIVWALFLIVMGFSMMPGTVTLCMIIAAFFGFLDGLSRIKKEKEAMAKRRKKRCKDLYDAEGWII